MDAATLRIVGDVLLGLAGLLIVACAAAWIEGALTPTRDDIAAREGWD